MCHDYVALFFCLCLYVAKYKRKKIYANPPETISEWEKKKMRDYFVEEYKAILMHKKSVKETTITPDEFLYKT